ncbi:uncharacterized protein LOC135935547 [Cloeon dipterum]|uniref:uncharacterized protein LOC135935547 n=1 Tax=Cloeon dipterum TaxID=197152 RepID=UPI00321F8DE6
MHPFPVTLLLIGCATSLQATNFDISDLGKDWPDLDHQESAQSNAESSVQTGAVHSDGDGDSGESPQQPKEHDPIDKYLLKDTDDFKIARDSNGRPILLSSIHEAGSLPLLYGKDGHGHLVQASSDVNFTLESIPAIPTDPVKASDLGANFEVPRGVPQAANPPSPAVKTSLSWPHHRPYVVEHESWPAPVNIYKGHHHGYESWPSEQKPVTADGPRDSAPQDGPIRPVAAGPSQYDERPEPMTRPYNTEYGQVSAEHNGPVSAGPVRYDVRPGDADMHMPSSYKGAPSSQFPQKYQSSKFNPEASGPWESFRTNPREPKGPWQSMRPESPEGPFYPEQPDFLGMKRAQPVQG